MSDEKKSEEFEIDLLELAQVLLSGRGRACKSRSTKEKGRYYSSL